MMTGFLFAFCTCVSLDFNSELFLAPYLYVCIVSLRPPRISRIRDRKKLLVFFLARACGPDTPRRLFRVVV